ncbi:uncharacterized protein C18orf63-like isoform X2 [Dysidea avara]|uniref:uncharacterized protein C18orf63-like isoform X2 n=1 Tax=Dysidea avara TaxID=196820 RepID=UPI0033311883
MDKQQYLYFVKRPPVEGLEVFTLALKTTSSKTVPLLPMKCRELARADINSVVAPVPDGNNYAWAIAKTGYFKEHKVEQRLSELGFEIITRNPVTTEVLKACYQFSMMARLAPKWNRISSYLIQGSEIFLTGKSHYVEVDVNINMTEIVLAVRVGQIRLVFLKPEDLATTTSILHQYKCSVDAVIDETMMESRRCILLPNCTRGNVYSVSHLVPKSPEFATYNSIRLHWKKHHGFMLPDKQDTFFQIYFSFKPSQLLSYPGCCVLQQPPITYKCKDAVITSAAFVDCLHSRLPSLCGHQLNYTARPLYPIVGLTTALHCNHSPANVVPVRRNVTNLAAIDLTSSKPAVSESKTKPSHPYKPTFPVNKPYPVAVAAQNPISCISQQSVSAVSPNTILSQPTQNRSHSTLTRNAVVTSVSVQKKPPALLSTSTISHKDDKIVLHDNTNEDRLFFTQISKQKIAVLKKWLTENNVKFKAKTSKKDDLIKLVATHIKETGKPFVFASEE